MTKLGGSILAVIVLAGLAFASMLSIDPAGPRPRAPEEAAPSAPQRPTSTRLVLPVAGVAAAQLRNTWGDSRGGGDRLHRAIDIAAPRGASVLAAAPGTVEKLFESKAGGTTLYVRSPDRATSYYYAHLADYAPGIREGVSVKSGTLLGYVGDTGNAGAGNSHLHFGISRMAPADRWWQGDPVNPYPLLAEGRAVR